MNSFIWGANNIFNVRAGKVGVIDDCWAFVFHYQDEKECRGAYEQATQIISVSPRFKDGIRNKQQYSMIDREDNYVLINQLSQFISIVVGKNKEKIKTISDNLLK